MVGRTMHLVISKMRVWIGRQSLVISEDLTSGLVRYDSLDLILGWEEGTGLVELRLDFCKESSRLRSGGMA